jgi:hypothetical protein
MKTTVKREKCLQDLAEVMKKAGWVLGAVSRAETGVNFDGPNPSLLEEALEDADAALESLQAVRVFLQEAVGLDDAPSAATAS